MFHTLIELPGARVAIGSVDTATRDACRAACRRLSASLQSDAKSEYAFTSRSHSGRWVAVGVSRRPIGVDIEVAQPRETLKNVARWLNFDDADDRTFFSHWTLRESLAKCVGGSVLEQQPHEPALRAAIRKPGELIDAGAFSALCGQLEGGIYYSLVLKNTAICESIRCA